MSLETRLTAAFEAVAAQFNGLPTPKYVEIRDEKSSGTDGGALTANTWNVRDLNTIVEDEIGDGVSVAANVVTLPAGDYYIEAAAPVAAVFQHQLGIEQKIASVWTLVKVGRSNRTGSTGTSGGTAEVRLKITLAGSTELRLVHHTRNTTGALGAGSAADSGEVEVYAEFIAWRL